jgi:large subunit ribosomal protein L4
MATYEVKNLDGQKVGELELDDAVFGAEVKEHLLWEVVKYQRAKQRAGTHSTLRRSEVSGGGKKPFRQKGTGNARQGSSRSPQFVGGGRVFTPKPRDYEYAVPKKVRAGALRSALSLRAKEAKLVIVDQFALGEIKTKRVAQVLAKLAAGKVLVVDGKDNRELQLSVRNLPTAKFVAPEGVNVYDVLNHETLLLTRATALALQERLRTGSTTLPAAEGGAA